MKTIQSTFTDFWQSHPAVLYSLSTLLGASIALYSIGSIFLILFLLFFIVPLLTVSFQAPHLRILLAIFLGIVNFYFTTNRYHFPEDLSSKQGIAEIEILSIRLAKTPFGRLWKYKANLKSFIHNDKIIAQDIPVTISIPFDKETPRPPASFIYQFPALLKTTSNGEWVIKPIKNAVWHATQKLHNLVEWRLAAKSSVREHIQESIQDSHTKAFLSGIAIGEFDDRLLSYELGRFGLQHLIAISGLHFSILSSLLMLALGLIFSRNVAAIITISMMSAYFLFLGPSASVTRAWIALTIGLVSCFIHRRSSGLNALGIGMLAIVLWNPLAIKEIGFQFSFAVTAAILLWYSPCDTLLQRIFKKRRLNHATKMDSWDQHGYCLLHFLRQSFALTLAVNLIALPLTLYHFHIFPMMGLIYNLFFPFLMSFSLMLLTISCFFFMLFPWLGMQLHHINESYTRFILDFTFNLPKSFDVNLQINGLSQEGVMIYLLIIFCIGIFFKERFRLENFAV